MSYLVPDNVYKVLKWLGLIALPAVAVFCGTVLPVWDVDATLTDAIVTTLNASGVLIGALIAVSAATASVETAEAEEGESEEEGETEESDETE